jgi:hypothetical protein
VSLLTARTVGTMARTEGSMSERDFKSFEEFWPFYVSQHSKKGTRLFHFAGTTAGMACAAAGLLFRSRLLMIAAPVVGYAGSWMGHFLVEKNTPATFKHPLWSLQADFVMWKKILDGTMDAEVERVLGRQAPAGARSDFADVGDVAPPRSN